MLALRSRARWNELDRAGGSTGLGAIGETQEPQQGCSGQTLGNPQPFMFGAAR
jgi:hypothetical protein